MVTMQIQEGPRTVWGRITSAGDEPALSGKTARWFKELQTDRPADPRLLQKALALSQETYADYGHPYAQFAAYWDIDSTRWDTAHIGITVAPGPVAHFGRVAVAGNTFTKPEVVRRELAFKPGDIYARRKVLESQNNIYRTGLFTFTRLQVNTENAPADSALRRDPDFTVRVVERKPSYVEFATGAGQDRQQDLTWDYSLEWGNRNWLGTGRHWALQAKSGLIVVTDWRVLYNRFAARYTQPWVLGLRLPTTLQFAYEPGVRSAVQPYRIERIEGELSFQALFGRTKKAWLSLVYENVRIFGIDRPIEEILREKGITIKRKAVFALEKDSRPNIFVPAAGSLSRVDVEYAGGPLGGDVDFYKIVGSWARYQTVSASVFATRFQFGWVKSHSGSGPVPTIDRFYLGGANSIRGYPENRVGPTIDGTPEGGAVIGVANLELRTPVIWKFWFTVFGDAGNNWRRFRRMSSQDVLVSLGAGVQYASPVGPLRVDYARRIIHPGHLASDRLHLAILFAF
jgi:outer membrane protein insertion porin family